MDLLTWLIVGLVAGVLASLVMGGTGYGIIGDIIVGIAGAFVGSWLLAKMGTGIGVGGLPGTIIVAFIGAVVLLFVIRLLRGAFSWTVPSKTRCVTNSGLSFHFALVSRPQSLRTFVLMSCAFVRCC